MQLVAVKMGLRSNTKEGESTIEERDDMEKGGNDVEDEGRGHVVESNCQRVMCNGNMSS